jgi:DASH complex subunit DAD1
MSPMSSMLIRVAVQVGHEFSSVEALWSQFENVMAKEPEDCPRDNQKTEGEGEAARQDEGMASHVRTKDNVRS